MSELSFKAAGKPAMKIDPFRPADPQLPGVRRAATAPPKPRAFPVKLVLLGATVLALMAAGAWHLIRLSRDTVPSATAEPAPGAVAEAASAPAPAALPVAPGAVARVADLREPWAAQQFYFRKPFTEELLPALVVRLPGESGGYWGFSLREPFGRCDLEFVTDRERLAREFGYRAQHPMVVDRCNGSVYHPLRWGTLPNGAVARGEVVAGPAIRPPLAVQIAVRGGEIHALRIEP